MQWPDAWELGVVIEHYNRVEGIEIRVGVGSNKLLPSKNAHRKMFSIQIWHTPGRFDMGYAQTSGNSFIFHSYHVLILFLIDIFQNFTQENSSYPKLVHSGQVWCSSQVISCKLYPFCSSYLKNCFTVGTQKESLWTIFSIEAWCVQWYCYGLHTGFFW